MNPVLSRVNTQTHSKRYCCVSLLWKRYEKVFIVERQLAVAGVLDPYYRFWQNNRSMDRINTVGCGTGRWNQTTWKGQGNLSWKSVVKSWAERVTKNKKRERTTEAVKLKKGNTLLKNMHQMMLVQIGAMCASLSHFTKTDLIVYWNTE